MDTKPHTFSEVIDYFTNSLSARRRKTSFNTPAVTTVPANGNAHGVMWVRIRSAHILFSMLAERLDAKNRAEEIKLIRSIQRLLDFISFADFEQQADNSKQGEQP